jgi:hypothetical protein
MTEDTKPRATLKDAVDRLNDSLSQRFTEKQVSLVQEELIASPDDRSARGSHSVFAPRYFTRVSPFELSRDRISLDDKISWQDGKVYVTSWGRMRRWGPALNLYDEDTLFGVIALCRQKKLRGSRADMTIPVPRLTIVESGKEPLRSGESEVVTVVSGSTTAYQINDFLGRGTGGDHLDRCRESVRRIALNGFLIENEQQGKEGVFHLFRYVADKDLKGEIIFQFDPVMVALMEHGVWLDMRIRAQLKAPGIAIHRFLSSQLSSTKPEYSIHLDKLAGICNYSREIKFFRQDTQSALKTLKDIGWLDEISEIVGSGRSVPFKLNVRKILSKQIPSRS